MGVFRRAGRVLYRFGLEAWVAGRVLYRGVCAAWLVGGGRREKVLPASVVCVWTGIIFSLLAPNGLKWAFFAVLGEFCTGLALRWGLPGEFCTGLALHAVCPESFVPGRVRCVASGWWSAEKVLPARVVCLLAVIIFSLLAPNGLKWAFSAVLGEFCIGCGHAHRVLGELCTGGCLCGGASAPLGGFTCALVGRGGHQVGYRCR